MGKLVKQDFVVRCTPEEAFDYLSDLRNELEWNPGLCESVKRLDEGPVSKGSRYLAKWKGSPEVEVEYLEVDRPRSWRAHSGGSMESHFSCEVSPHPEGARVQTELEIIPHGLFRLAYPLFLVLFNSHAKTASRKIRTTINARYADAATAP